MAREFSLGETVSFLHGGGYECEAITGMVVAIGPNHIVVQSTWGGGTPFVVSPLRCVGGGVDPRKSPMDQAQDVADQLERAAHPNREDDPSR